MLKSDGKPSNSEAFGEIDRNLKQAFDDLANQPIPDRFTDLLAQLKAESANKDGSADGS